MTGTLYLVGTPIGNLEDMSPRGVRILNECDFIAAEDTRVSAKLLNHFGIKKPMISYYAHNMRERGEQIVSRIHAGESCAIITDAGMPCISDPGEDLVSLCAEQGITTVVIPGPSAVVSAVALSGLCTSRFTFEGFLSVKRNSRFEHLESLRDETRTMVFYEAPHKLRATLHDMLAVLGDRKIALARELTKIHEEVVRTTLAQASVFYKEHMARGEFVLVIEGTSPLQTEEQPPDEQEAVQMVRALCENGMSLPEAAKQVARQTGYKKGSLYRLALLGDVPASQD